MLRGSGNYLKLMNMSLMFIQVELDRFQSELSRLNAHGMRYLANKYTAALIQTIHRIVHGTSEALTIANGQTMEEETQSQG